MTYRPSGPTHRSAVLTSFAELGLVAVFLFSGAVMRLRFYHSVVIAVVLTIANAGFLTDDRYLTNFEKHSGAAITLFAYIVALVSNYDQNRDDRVNFLSCLRGDLLVERLELRNNQLEVTIGVDALTGLPNRYSFNHRLNALWAATRSEKATLSVVVIDIDHFKLLNDTYGHLFGDAVLKRVAHLLAEGLRGERDFIARYGGEEFVILLPNTSLPVACLVAERMRSLIECAGLPPLGKPLVPNGPDRATISCGVADCSDFAGRTAVELIGAADDALYKAKRRGRNRVCVYVPE